MDSTLTEIAKLALPVVGAILAYVVRTGIQTLKEHNKLRLTQQQWARLEDAGKGAGNIAYEYLAARSHGVEPAVARQAAFEAGVAYLQSAAAPAIASLGIPQSEVEDRVRSQIGALLAVDPNVSVQAKLNPPP